MTIHQISIFIENKLGSLNEILDIIKSEKVQIIASTVSDTVEYGIYRVITPEPRKTYLALKSKGLAVNLTEVFAISLVNTVGTAADTISYFTHAGINIEYMYSFYFDDRGILIIRTNDTTKTLDVIASHNLSCLNENDLLHFN